MTLEWTSIDVPIGQGVDTKTNEKLLKPPSCADLSDAVFPASGLSGYETRRGYTKIRTETTLSEVDSLVTLNNELLALGGDKLYSVSTLANSVDLIDKGNLLAVAVNQETLDTQAINQTDGQIIVNNGVQVHSWLDSGTGAIRYTVTDSVTGARIVSNEDVALVTKAKLATTENSILLIGWVPTTTSMVCVVIPTYAPGSTTTVELCTDVHLSGLFDIIESGHDTVFVAYKNDTPGISSMLVGGGGQVTSRSVVAASHATVCMAVSVSAYKYFVLAATATAIDAYGSSDFPTTTGTWSTESSAFTGCINLAYRAQPEEVPSEDGTEEHWAWAETAGASAQFNYVQYFTGIGYDGLDFTSPASTKRQCSIASSAFVLNGEPYVHVAFDTTLQRQYFLVNTAFEVQAKCCVQEGVGIGGGNVTGHLPRVVNGLWAPVFREHLSIDIDPDDSEVTADVFAQYGLKRVEYDLTYRPQAVEYGDCSYINAGLLWSYDGATLAEQGFNVYPEGITTAGSNSAGSLSSSSSYSYRVYYEWINAFGERRRSATAKIVTVATGATEDTITLTIPTLTHTNLGTAASIVVYRTEADPNLVGGAPMYRVSSPNPADTGANGYVANDPTSDTVDFIDYLDDESILTKELDYLNSGEVDNTSPTSATVIGEAKGRVFLAGFEKENRAQYSKLNSRGRDQLEFQSSFLIDVPEFGGAITAFGELNYHAVMFKAGAIYAVSGEGKNNIGAGFYNQAQVVSLDIGCIEPRSVVNIPQGILFKSAKGIWRLGHNLDLQYVGADVEAYNSQDVTSATLVPYENHVVFLSSTGRALVYNYLIQAWSTFTNHTGTSGVIWNGVYVYARTDGSIYLQDDSYTDDGVHYAMKFITAPIGVKGVQGKQRIRHIRLLGQYYSPHNLRVGLKFNHEPGVSEQGTWDPSDGVSVSVYGSGDYGSGAYGGSGNPVYQARFNMPRQKCQTVQFVIDTTNTEAAGRAVSIQAIQIEVGAKVGTGELSVNNSFSGGTE